jgi:hypothetical protein
MPLLPTGAHSRPSTSARRLVCSCSPRFMMFVLTRSVKRIGVAELAHDGGKVLAQRAREATRTCDAACAG